MSEQVKHPLVGHEIVGVDLAADKKALRIRVKDAESIRARANGGCCSLTWVEALDTPDLLIGGTVTAVEDLDWHDRNEEVDYGLVQHYGCRISTTKGACVIDYRNESNGYYGGDLVWDGEEGGYFYGGVHGQNVSDEEWRTVAGRPPTDSQETKD